MSVNTSNLCMRYSSESMISVRVFMVFEACRRYTFAYTEMNRSVEQRTKHDERECVIYESKRLSRVQDDRSLQTYLQLRTIRACWRDTSDFSTFHGCSYFESRRRSFSCEEEANCNVDETRWRKSATSDTIERNQIASASIRRI